MGDNYKDALGIINEATKDGQLTSDDKKTIKEMIYDKNGIVIEILDDFKENNDKADLIKRIKEYLKLCESGDDDDNNMIAQLGSPDGERLMDIKKKRGKAQKEDDDVGFANIEECEEGLSPKIVFNKK